MSEEIVTVSTKGQISIPKKIRDTLKIKEGKKYVIYITEDNLILKPLEIPTLEDFFKEISINEKFVKEAKFTDEMLEKLIKEYRKTKK